VEHELVLILFGVTCGLIGIIYSTLVAKQNKVEVKVDNVIPRVQSLEDIQGTKIDMLIVKIDLVEKSNEKLTEKVNTLATNFHSSKNIEGQLNQTMNAILKHLQHEKPN
jgi:hypothetical protein